MFRYTLTSAIVVGFVSLLAYGFSGEATAEAPPKPSPTVLESEPADRRTKRILEAIDARPKFVSQDPTDPALSSVTSESLHAIVPDTTVVPGQLVSGQALQKGELLEVILPRGPATISIDLPPGAIAKPAARIVPVGSRLPVDNAVREIWYEHQGAVTAPRARYFAQTVHSRREAAARLNVSASTALGLVDGEVDIKNDYFEDSTVFVAVLEQIYYSASCHAPESPAAIFGAKVTANDFAAKFNKADPPCYISDVHYGRFFALVMKTRTMKQADAETLKAGINLIIAGASTKLTAVQRTLLERTEVRAFAIGGPPELTLAAMSGTGLDEYIQNGSRVTKACPAVPIAYTARYLRDNSIARVTRVYPAAKSPRRVRVTILGFKLMRAHDGDNEEDLDVLLGVNGKDLYNVRNLNHYVFGEDPGHDVYAVGRSVELDATSEVIITCRVQCRDWDEPSYGTKEAVHSIPLRTLDTRDSYFEHEENKGRWKVEYRIEQLAVESK